MVKLLNYPLFSIMTTLIASDSLSPILLLVGGTTRQNLTCSKPKEENFSPHFIMLLRWASLLVTFIARRLPKMNNSFPGFTTLFVFSRVPLDNFAFLLLFDLKFHLTTLPFLYVLFSFTNCIN